MTEARVAVRAVTLDFGNTLVRVNRPGLRGVVEDTADALHAAGSIGDHDAFLAAWDRERARQFLEDVPEFREPDIPRRAVRVLASLRGMPPPAPEARWDDVAAAGLVDPGEVDALVDVYSRAFIARLPPVADAAATLERLASRGFALGILSNWPLTVAIERYVAAHGWDRYLRAIVVSERVGSIKPHHGIFRAAEAALGVAGGAGERAGRVPILHVGDDWAADVLGASRAGWRTAYLRDRQGDTPLPTSARDAGGDGPDGGAAVLPDLEIDELAELDARVDLADAADLAEPVHPADP